MKVLITILLVVISKFSFSQVTCSGSYTSTAASCQRFTIGNGTPGGVRICLTSNNIPTANCNPGGVCNPPFNGGGWGPRLNIYSSGGALLQTWISTTATGSCFTVNTLNGYAEIIGVCMGAGTSFSWTTINPCGADACTSGTCAPICSTCNSGCPACGFATTPAVNTVTTSCPNYTFALPPGTGSTVKRCATFSAASSTVNFGVIISSNCQGGNVSSFTWTLSNASCGSNVLTGDLFI